MKKRTILGLFASFIIMILLLINKNALMTSFMKVQLINNTEVEMESYKNDQIQIYYPPGQENILSDILNLMPKMVEEQTKWFPDFQIHDTLPIFLIDAQHPLYAKFFDETKKGIYYVDLQLVLLNAEAYAPENNFVHEYAHFILDQYLEQTGLNESALPMWFIEGFANAFEWHTTKEASESVYYYEPIPFTALTEITTDNRVEVYSQGFHAIIDLIHHKDVQIIKQLIDATASTGQFELAFEEHTHLQYHTYHEQFEYDRELLRNFHTLALHGPEQFILEAENFIHEQPTVHPLTADIAELLYKTHKRLGNRAETIEYAQLASSLSRNTSFLLQVANTIGESAPELRAHCIEKALFFSKKDKLEEANEIAKN